MRSSGTGWLPDYPDDRDHTIDQDTVPLRLQGLGQTASVKKMLSKTGVAKAIGAGLPPAVDLRPWSSPVENRGSFGRIASAGVGIVEYFERPAFGRHVDASRRS